MIGKGRIVIFKYNHESGWVDFVGVFDSYTYETEENDKYLRVTVYIEHVKTRTKEYDTIRIDTTELYKLYSVQECKDAGVEYYLPIDSPYAHVLREQDRNKIENIRTRKKKFIGLVHEKYGGPGHIFHFLKVVTIDNLTFQCMVSTETEIPIEIDGYEIVSEEITRGGGYSDTAGYFFDFDSNDPDYNPCL